MRNKIIFIIGFILLLSLSKAEDVKCETGKDLYFYWEKGLNYPDYVCGMVFSEEEGKEGVYIIGVVDSDYIETVMNLVNDKKTLEVKVQKYSYKYLTEIGEKINNKYGGIIAAVAVNQRLNSLAVIVRDKPSDAEKKEWRRKSKPSTGML